MSSSSRIVEAMSSSLFPTIRKQRLETDRTSKLYGISLKRRPIRKLFEVLQPQSRFMLWKCRVHCESERVDCIAIHRRSLRNPRPGRCRRLPLLISHQAGLELKRVSPQKRAHHRVVEIESLSRIRAGAFLDTMEFIHFEPRQDETFVLL